MSASIYTLLAEELEISDAKAKKLLSAMLREVQKRARRDGVQLPNFGRFKEEDGTLVFEPDDSLAVAVNHRFEGLSAEDLSSAPMDEGEDESQSEGPSTITLGYQADSNWSPLDDDAPAETDDEGTDSDDAPDTAEFQVPDVADPSESADSTEEPDDGAPDTAEISTPAGDTGDQAEDASPDSAPDAPPPEEEPAAPVASTSETDDAPSEDESSAPERGESRSGGRRSTGARETEKLYPLVEDVPGSTPDSADDDSSSDSDSDASETDSPSMAPPGDDRERDSLSGIWDDEEEEETADASAPAPSEPADEDDRTPATAETSDSDSTESTDASSSRSPSTEFEMPEPDPPEPDAEDRDPKEASTESAEASSPTVSEDSGSSIARVLVSILVFLLLGGGAWYILGQRGMVQSPRATVAQLKTTLQAGPSTDATQNSTSVVPEFSPSDETAADTSTATAAAPTPDSTPTASALPSGSDDVGTNNTGSDGAETTSSAPSSPDPSPSETASREPTTRDTTAPSSEADAAPAPDTTPESAALTIAPDEGGWSIIVASRTDPEAARSVAETFRDRFRDQKIPTGILEASVDNSTRYRVGVGQFSSQSDVQRFLDEHSGELPDGAWAIRL